MKPHGNPLNSPVPQPGAKVSVNQFGVIAGKAAWKVDVSRALASVPRIGAPHPYAANCYAVDSEIDYLTASVALISTDYIGLARDPSGVQVEFVGATGEEPIETHPKFATGLAGDADKPKTGAYFDPKTGVFKYFTSEAGELAGVKSYLVPSSTVRCTFFTGSNNYGLYNLGERTAPPSGSNIPSPPGSRNWLLTSWSRRTHGLVYQVTIEYTASGPAGWSRKIYD